MNATINMAEYAAQILNIPQAPTGMEALAQSYKVVKTQIDTLTAQADALKADMIKVMDTMQVDKYQAGAFTIRYQLVETSRIDTKALKATAPDIAEQFTVRSTSTRFTVN